MKKDDAIEPVPNLVLHMRKKDHRDEYGNSLCGMPNLVCEGCGHRYDNASVEDTCPNCGEKRTYCKNRMYKDSEESGTVPMCYIHYNVYYGVLGSIMKDADKSYVDELISLLEGADGGNGLIDLRTEAMQAKLVYLDLLGSDASESKKIAGFKDLSSAVTALNKLSVQNNLIEDYVKTKVAERLSYAKAIAYQLLFSLYERMFGKDHRMDQLKERLSEADPMAMQALPRVKKRIERAIDEGDDE